MESVTYEGNMKEQGGGHGYILKCKVQPGDIPCISKPLNHSEGKAYQDLQNTPLKNSIPTFYGIHKENDQDCLIISDITSGFKSPCLADFKVGRRHYDINATQEKIQGLVEKQKGTTTESIAVRLIDAKIRKDGSIVQSWDRKQGLKFTYEDLQTVWSMFLPTPYLRDEIVKKLDAIYSAFDETFQQNPGLRMYASSILIAYDGDDNSETPDLRVVLIDFAHTHLSIIDEGCDADDETFEDGVLEGISSLMNFEFQDVMMPGTRNYNLEEGPLTYIDDPNQEDHPALKLCVFNPGEHQCFIRENNPNESNAYTLLESTPINNYIPKLYSIENNSVVFEDYTAEFSSPCIADFKIGRLTFDLDCNEDVRNEQKAKDEELTTKALKVRLAFAKIMKNQNVERQWKRNVVDLSVNSDEGKLKQMISEFVINEVSSDVIKQLKSMLKAYEKTLKENPNFRIYNLSVLIIYNGDDLKKKPKCAFSHLEGCHMNIATEKFDPKDSQYDDGVLEGLANLISMSEQNTSKCCLLI